MSLRISKIEIKSFKAFERISLDLEKSSLVTFDGPNGYGKTSIFEAVELLLTGQVRRVHNLFNQLMTKNKSNYEDNLFWNINSKEDDLSIKIEFIDNNSTRVLARRASADVFRNKSSNRADNFAPFLLYELPNFESEEYTLSNQRNEEFLSRVFGTEFKENFSFLNYLGQGQNELLYKRVDARREAIGKLLNISDVIAEIKKCRDIESRMKKIYFNADRQAKEEALREECEFLREMVQGDPGRVEYKRLSTQEAEPSWDRAEPFPTFDFSIQEEFHKSINGIRNLFPLKSSIVRRLQNEAIEDNIRSNEKLLKNLAELGTDFDSLDSLSKIRGELSVLTRARRNIKKGASAITLEQARALPGLDEERLALFESQIATRDDLQARNSVNEISLAELERLKRQLLDEHFNLYPDDSVCPLCGSEWESHTLLVEVVEQRSKQISEALGRDGLALVELVSLMTDELSRIDAKIREQELFVSSEYNDSLYKALVATRFSVAPMRNLLDHLKTLGAKFEFSFSDDAAVVADRLEYLYNVMRSKKKEEQSLLPDDWRTVIESVFLDISDFLFLDMQDLDNKTRYLTVKANEARNIKLQKSRSELKTIQSENRAAERVATKLSKLRQTLLDVERSYAQETISAIELVFHIYSGRLIQNYQRGLGLFIESHGGKTLRFLTAEKSDHDAIMSMSTGQVSALSLAFFLALNRIYADVSLILIDDPSQSLDEVNIASLTDLLRCELKDCQLLVSSHEENISAYMRYRFGKAGLSTKSFNMQRIAS